ncbi:LytTR family DNA-binding domain-containing protein [Lachnospiraceae bacterium 62-35]
MIKIAVCDDEAMMCDLLKDMISEKLTLWKENFCISCYLDSSHLLDSSLDFDLIFLDIRMPGLDGIALAKKLRQLSPACALIFVTILKEYMPEVFELEAVDYICKPVDEGRLERALKRTLKRLKEEKDKCLFIHTPNWCRTIKLKDISYCEVINRKIYLHTKTGVIEYYGKMKELEQQISPHFIKCHRSYLINPDYLQEYAGGEIILETGERIPVSRLQRQSFMETMLQYMKGGEHL